MSSASATAGSSIVTIRPTMTRPFPSDPASPAVLVGAGASATVHDEDVGELVPARAQPATRRSTTSAAELGPNHGRDANMGHLLRGLSAATGPVPTEGVRGCGFVQSPSEREAGGR